MYKRVLLATALFFIITNVPASAMESQPAASRQLYQSEIRQRATQFIKDVIEANPEFEVEIRHYGHPIFMHLTNGQFSLPKWPIRKLPDSIGTLVHLTKINLEGNQLTSLPDSIGKLVNLTDLNF